MKIKENFVLRQVAGTWVVLSVADTAVNFNGMLTLNESGLELWRLLELGSTREKLATFLTEEYDVSYEQALLDVDVYLEKLNRAGCIDQAQ